MPRIKNGKDPSLCNEKDCFNPRHKTQKHAYGKCESHMRELWRKYKPSEIERPVARKPVGDGLMCSLCRRTPQQAAHTALYGNVWCSACTPLSTPRADLEKRLTGHSRTRRESSSYDAQKLRNERDQLESDLAEALRQIDALRQTAVESRGLQVQAEPPSHKIVIVDYGQNCLHYLAWDQSSAQSMPPTERDLRAQLEADQRDGFLVTYTPQLEVVLP